MERWWAWQFALVTLATTYLTPSQGKNVEFPSDTLINNVVVHPRTGRLYVGAVNSLYQLSPDLGLESRTETGPKRDNRQCTPPVTDACEEAVDTDNHNKLLLVHEAKDVLVVCGSVFRGICSLRNLSNVEQLLYFSDTKGEKSYVASAEERVSVVGVILSSLPSQVGKGYGSHDSTKLISTRILQDYGDWVVFDSIIEASAVQANPFVLRYLHDFRFAFKDDGFVYFVFSRTLGVQDTKNFTFISRMCEDDQGYFSYTELQLNCSAAYVATPGNVLAQTMTKSGKYGQVSASDKVLFVTFTSDEDPSTSAMCRCHLDNNIAKYKCGAEFLPSPLASKAEFALTAEPSLVRKGHLTAVAVAVEMRHAVAFLGTATGEVLKVHLSAHPEVYGRAPGEVTGDKVNKNLLFDSSHRHLYITTEKKVPVQACHLKTDCHSCVSMKDPYCGWCVLEGRCTRKQECSRSMEQNTWLWSPDQQCVQIQSFNPPNLSCKKTQQVGKERAVLEDVNQHAYFSESFPSVVESPPRITRAHTHTHTNTHSHPNIWGVFRCIACVTSEWGCQWNARDHSCSDRDDGVGGDHIRDSCPQFESPEPLLIPVGFEIPISFQGRNLDIYTVSYTHTDKEVTQEQGSKFKFTGYEVSVKDARHQQELLFIPVIYWVVLYNCSVGREDCSLCKHADATYQCVWCAASRTCVYQDLCPSPQPAQCPDPEITDIIPRFGPLNGRISVTIRGSNMGIKKEDIKKITVAGVDCDHQADRYSFHNQLKTPCCTFKYKQLNFIILSFQDPKPVAVEPAKGPAAGGTIITIKGEDLDTATKDDVTVTVGGFPCEVMVLNYYCIIIFLQQLMVKLIFVFVCVCVCVCVCSGGRRIVVVGSGFDLIQRATMKVLPFPDEFSQNTTPVEVSVCVCVKNDTVLQFESPEVKSPYDSQSLRTVLYLDNMNEELKGFDYHPDPTFNDLAKNGRGFSKAMTAKEAQAFVGDASCHVNILQDDKLILEAPSTQPKSRSKRQRRDTTNDLLELVVKFGHGEWLVGSVYYARKDDIPLAIIIPAVIIPMLLFIAVSVYCYRRKSQQAEREYEKVKHQLENLEESVRDRCKKEFTDLMIEMEDHTSDLSEARIPFLDYKTYTDRNFFLPSKDGANDTMITREIQIPEARKAIVAQALNQFSNLLNSKPFLINFIRTLESRPDFNARSRGYFASLLTVALHGKLEYYTDIMRTLLLELMDEHVQNKNPKLMLRRSETVVERMLCNWMSICLYQFLRDTAGEPLYKLFKALKHQVEKGPVDAKMKKAKYTLNDTGLLGDDVEYSVLTLQVLVHGEGPDVTPVKVLNCDTISQVKEKIIDQVYRNLPYSQRPKVENVALEWRPGSTGQILSDLDLTSQKEGRWKRLNTLAHYNVRDNATLVLSRVLHTQSFHQHQDSHEEKNSLLEDDNTFHLVRPADEIDEVKSKRGSMKDKAMTKAITEIYLTRLLSVKGTLQQFVDDFFRSVLGSSSVVPPAVKYFFDFLDEQALRHDNVDEETLHIWKTNSLPSRFWVNILRNPHFMFDVHVTEVVDASLHVIAQTFMDACTKTEHKLSRESPSNKLLYAKEISTYKKMVDDYYKGIRQMVPVSDQDMNTHLAEVSRQHTDKLNTQVALHQLYQYASKYYDVIIQSLDEDPAAQNKQLTLRLQQIAAALENKVTDL
uniref:Plexin b2a, tandem duplicate 1 n=1 Tax=Dicentrarchus labrax TaxID=13489 RepID=A0A8C4ELU8_DICLA